MTFAQLIRSIKNTAIYREVVTIMGGLATEAANSELAVALTYGASIAVNAVRGNLQTVTLTDGNAYQFDAPTNPPASGYQQLLTLIIVNASGGASGAGTFAAGYTASGAIPSLANGETYSVTFLWNGTAWVELNRSATPPTNAATFYELEVPLTNAEIKEMPTAYKTLVPAPGAGLILQPILAIVTINSTAGGYSGVDNNNSALAIGWGDDNQIALCHVTNDLADSSVGLETLLGVTTPGIVDAALTPMTQQHPIGGIDYADQFPGNQSNKVNEALKLWAYNGANFGGGNGSNSGLVRIVYMIRAAVT